MPDVKTALADVPRSHAGQERALPRPRLLGRLEQGRARALWLQGPTGSGKSLLLAQWPRAHGWPTVDLSAATTLADSWPVLRAWWSSLPEALPATPALAGRALAAALAQHQSGLCFDHVHAVEDEALLDMLAGLPAALTEPSYVVFCSHRPPPPHFAEGLADEGLDVLAHAALSFTPDEARELAQHHGVAPQHADELHGLTGGWAVGLALGLRYLGDFPPVGPGLGELRERLSTIVERKLLPALLPEARAQLHALSVLSGIPHGLVQGSELQAFLNECVRDGVWVQWQPAQPWASPRYVLGDLLKQAARMRSVVHPLAFDDWAARLQAGGEWELAFECRGHQGLWSPAAELLSAQAEALLQSGRGATLLRLAQALPLAVIESTGRLPLWLAQAWVRFDEAQAKPWLERAHASLLARGDEAGALKAAALALWVLRMESGDYTSYQPWVQRFKAGWASLPSEPLGELSLDLLVGRVALALFSDADELKASNDAVAALNQRLGSLPQDHELPHLADDWLAAAWILAEAWFALGHPVEMQAWIDRVMASPAMTLASPLLRARWHLFVFDCEQETGKAQHGRGCLDQAWALAQTHELPHIGLMAGLGLVRHHLDRGDAEAARALLATCQPIAHAAGAVNHLLFLSAQTRTALAQQRHSAALQSAREALAFADRSNIPRDNQGRWVVDLHHAHAAVGQYDLAAQVVEAYVNQAEPGDQDFFRCLGALAQALRWRHDDEARHLACLTQGMALAAQEQYAWFFRPLPELAAVLCADALTLGLVPDFVLATIGERGLLPPPDASASWPWPLKIHTLGGLRLELAGEPVVFGGKVPQRPLDVLCALAGASAQGMERQALVRLLWDDGEVEVEAGGKALDVALVRLRKLLGSDELVVSANGRVALNAQKVWVDVQRLRQLEAAAQHAEQHGEMGLAMRVSQALPAVMGGDFLGQDERWPWIIAARAQHRQCFVRAVTAVARVLHQGQRWAASVDGLEAAIALDPVAEPLYQALIKAHLARQDANEAGRVYRRCRDMLSLLTGASPSAATLQLKAQIDQGS